MERQTNCAEDLIAELAWIGMSVTQVAAASFALLACDSGAKESNGVGQVPYFHDFAMG